MSLVRTLRSLAVAAMATLSLLTAAGCGRLPRLEPLPSVDPGGELAELVELRARVEALQAQAGVATEELADAYRELAVLAHGNGAPSLAEACYRNQARLAPADGASRYRLAHLLRERGDSEGALRALSEIPRADGGAEPVELLRAGLLVDLGRLDEAAVVLDRLLSERPASAAARAARARIRLVRGELEGARDDFEEALRLQPAATRVHAELAPVLQRLGDAEGARTHASAAGEGRIAVDDPWLAEVESACRSATELDSRAAQAVARGDLESALALLDRALELDPGNVSAMRNRGGVLLRMRRPEEAERVLGRALALDPDAPETLFNLGVAARALGRDDEAAGRYRAALEAAPGHLDARFNLAVLELDRGDPEEAHRQFVRVAELDPARVDAWRGAARAALAAGDSRAALAVLEDGARATADRRELVADLARLLAAAPDDRVRDGRRALTLARGLVTGAMSVDEVDALAKAHAETGDLAEAQAVQRRLVAVIEGSPQAHLLPYYRSDLERYLAGRPSRTPWPEAAGLSGAQ